MKRTLSFASLALLAWLVAGTAARADIFVGPYTPSTTTPFVVPIDIRDAAYVTFFQFDLAYDAADVQINTACDPFADPFCDPVTGPVTQGPFFGSLSPFNVFNPGFILLDGAGNQTGTLLAVNDTFGGGPPLPSGNGTLAYVEFVTTSTGSGSSPITVTNATPASSVPEPATIVLLALALMLSCALPHTAKRVRAIPYAPNRPRGQP